MKNSKHITRISILLFACLVLLCTVIFSGCGGNDAPDMDATANSLDEFYEEYGIRLADRMNGQFHTSASEPFSDNATLHVVDVDTTREEITIPETLNGKPITAIEINWDVEGEHALDDGYVTKDCGALKKLVISKNITTIKSTNNTEGENAPVGWSVEYFEVAEDNPVFCSVDGIIYNKQKTEIVWVPKGIKGVVTLPDTVTRLSNVSMYGGTVFSGCKNLEGLIIPDSVKSIDLRAIKSCTALKTLTIPFVPMDPTYSKVTLGNFVRGSSLESVSISRGKLDGIGVTTLKQLTLGDDVELSSDFRLGSNGSLTMLEEVRLPSNMTEIPDYLFSDCSALKKVNIPESVTSIGIYAFSGCSSLKSITIPKNVTVINEGLLSGCYSLETIYFNAENITEVNTYDTYKNTGAHTRGVTIIIGKDVTHIPKDMFNNFGQIDDEGWGSGKLIKVEFEKGSKCTSIGERAFYYNCNLRSVALGESITEIGNGAFEYCDKIIEIANRSSMELTNDNSGYLYNDYDPDLVIHSGDSLLTPYEEYWFLATETPRLAAYLGTATDLTLPVSLNNAAYEIGSYAFQGCKALRSVVIPDSVVKIGGSAFFNCTELETVTIGKNVKSIGSGAFGNANKIKTVYYNAIECADFTGVYQNGNNYNYRIFNELNGGDSKLIIGADVKRIPAYFLKDCGQFAEVVIPENSACEEIGVYAFENTGFMKSLLKSTEPTVTYLGKTLLCVNRAYIGEVVVREGTTAIAADAFLECRSVTSVVLPDSVKSIGDSAFCRTAITSISLPEGLTELGEYAFYECVDLLRIDIPAGVTEIKELTFAGCTELLEITGGEGLLKVDKNAVVGSEKIALTEFGNIKYRFFTPVEPVDKNITYAVFKKGTVEIPARFFENCEQLLSVYIPEDVESIGSYAFYNVPVQIRVFDERAEREGGSWKIVAESGNMKYYLDMTYSDVKFGTLFNGAVLDESGLVYLPSDGKIVGYIGTSSELTVPAKLSDTVITSIAPYAFYLNSTLTKVTVERGIGNIGECAFAYCTALKEVTLNGGTVLDIGAFMACSALEKVDASNGALTHIRPYAFGACTKLGDVKLSPTLLVINTSAFDGCTALNALTIPASVQIIEVNAFSGCTGITSVSFEKPDWYVANVEGDTRLAVNCSDHAQAAEMLCGTYAGWYWFEKGYGDANTEA